MRAVYSITSGASHGPGNSRKIRDGDEGPATGPLKGWMSKGGLVPVRQAEGPYHNCRVLKKAAGDRGFGQTEQTALIAL
jgi:hypothetical protein